MKRTVLTLLFTLFLVGGLIVPPAPAAVIVDTGQPVNNTGFFDTGNQSRYASEFTVTQDWTVTSISTYIGQFAVSGAQFTAAIYTDGGDVPGTLVYSSPFTGPTSGSSWYGPTGLDWSLIANTTYWVVVSAVENPSSNYAGLMWYRAPSGLANEAYWNGSSWQNADTTHYGWQINATAVPIPAAVWLLGSGLIGLIGIRRFRN